MIRFSYTDITKKAPTCRECENYCKSSILNSACMNANIKSIFYPKVSTFPEDDYKQLLHQIMISKCSAQTIIGMHCRNSFIIPNDHPTIGECQIFIDVMNIFREYLLEFKDVIKRNPALAIRTVFVVKSNKIISSSEMSELNKRLKIYANKTGNNFTTSEPVI